MSKDLREKSFDLASEHMREIIKRWVDDGLDFESCMAGAFTALHAINIEIAPCRHAMLHMVCSTILTALESNEEEHLCED